MSSRSGVRVALVGIFAALATAFLVADARSQPGRPGGITGRPPGGISGMPGGATGIPRPPEFGQPNFPQPPNFGRPDIPRPPGFGGPNRPGMPRWETVWQCGKCKAELARGDARPSISSCPRCGVRFVDGGGAGGGAGGGFGLFTPPPPADFGNPTTPNNDPDLLPRGDSGSGAGSTSVRPPSDTPPTPSEDKPTSKTGRIVLTIMVVVIGLLFLAGIIGGTFLIIAANKGSKPKAKRRSRDLDDDDDD